MRTIPSIAAINYSPRSPPFFLLSNSSYCLFSQSKVLSQMEKDENASR